MNLYYVLRAANEKLISGRGGEKLARLPQSGSQAGNAAAMPTGRVTPVR
jgi:hypothetical protein